MRTLNTMRKYQLKKIPSFESKPSLKNQSQRPRSTVVAHFLCGCLITAILVISSMVLAPGHELSERYYSLCTWDCSHYEGIVHLGYQSTIPPPNPKDPAHSNVAFFPGFPMAAKVLHITTGMNPKLSVLVCAQLFSIIFWILFLVILDSWGVSTFGKTLAVATVLAQPAAFYLVAGYSESIFMSAMLGMVYFTQRRKTMLVGLSGFIASASRIVGMPPSLFPVVVAISDRIFTRVSKSERIGDNPVKRWLLPVIAGILGIAGGGSFFLYCYLKFGHADLYMQTQKAGWGIDPDYLAIFHWNSLNYATDYDKAANLMLAYLIIGFSLIEIASALTSKLRGLSTRIPIYFCVLSINYINISGLATRWFYSMIRYVFPCVTLLLLCAAHILVSLPKLPRPIRYSLGALYLLACAVLFYLYEYQHWVDYLNFRWFA